MATVRTTNTTAAVRTAPYSTHRSRAISNKGLSPPSSSSGYLPLDTVPSPIYASYPNWQSSTASYWSTTAPGSPIGKH